MLCAYLFSVPLSFTMHYVFYCLPVISPIFISLFSPLSLILKSLHAQVLTCSLNGFVGNKSLTSLIETSCLTSMTEATAQAI